MTFRRISPRKSAWIAYLVPAVWICFVLMATLEFASKFQSVRESYVKSEFEKSQKIKARLESQFRQVYQSLRTLARLPAVRKIDRYGKNFNDDGRRAFQEIYNSLFNDFKISEIYIVPKGMNPDAIDLVTQKLQEPTITFDQFIVGKSAQSDSKKTKSLDEVEIFEYREMEAQLKQFYAQYPTEKAISGLAYPAIFSREVITCDNSFMNPDQPDDTERIGFIYSVPFFSENGEFKGMISAVILKRVFEEILPNDYFILKNEILHSEIVSKKFLAESKTKSEISKLLNAARNSTEESALIYSHTDEIDSFEQSLKWQLWSGQPDIVFYESRELSLAKQVFAFAILIVSFILISLFLFLKKINDHDFEQMKNLLVKFHGRSVAEGIIDQTIEVGGKARDVIVFFSDIRGFTQYAEKRPPQEIVSLLNEYFAIMIQIVERNHGIVDKFIGDSIMAVWGAPKRRPDDLRCAIMSCIEMRLALQEFNQQRSKLNLPPISIGMSLHAGPAIAGIIGSEQRMEYTVIGNTVNVASRIESLTKDYSTDLLVSQDIVNRADARFSFELAGESEARGLEHPLKLYKVKGYVNEQGITCYT